MAANVRVLCLGEILFDYLADQVGCAWAEVASWTPYPGGAPANVACGLAKLGTPAGFIGCVGQDAQGKQLVALLQSLGVDTTGLQRHPTAPTRKVYVVRSAAGDRAFAGFGGDEGNWPGQAGHPGRFADAQLEGAKLPERKFLEAEFLVVGTIGLAYPQTRIALFRALELAEQYDVKVVVDVNWRPVFWEDPAQAPELIKKLWPYVDFLKLSLEEADWLFGTRDGGAIFHRLGTVEGVLVSGGELPVSYCLSGNEGKLAPFALEVVDTTGAGDSFVAGFIHQVLTKGIAALDDPAIARELVAYACAAGGLTATKPGAIAAQPTDAEVLALLNTRI